MKSTLVIQNPEKPTQVKKINFKSHLDAYEAAVSLEEVMLDDGMKNRHLPLIFVTNEDNTTFAMSNGAWWNEKRLEDGRVVPGDTLIQMNIKPNIEVGEIVRDKMPLWAFTWGHFLG